MLGTVESAHAQSEVYGGAAVSFVTETHSAHNPLGGTTWGGSLLLGMSVSPRLSVEFEPSFVGTFEGEYTYRPGPSFRARVVTRRRDAFFTFQVRGTSRFLEPVVGVSYVRGTGRRQATLVPSGRPYFDDRLTEHAFALVGGIDVRIRLTSHFFFVPTFRAFVVARPDPLEPVPGGNPGGEQTGGGRFAFWYGAGARVAF